MTSRSKERSIKRNLVVKVMITLLLALGMFCAIFAIRSCRWFVFRDDEFRGNPLVQDWSFLEEIELESTITVGIFSYQPFYIDQQFDDDAASNATATPLDTAAGNEVLYRSFSHDECVTYSEFWVGTDYPWKFTSQFFIILGSMFAFASWSVMISGNDHFWIGSFFLLSAGLQCATIIASLSWCDQYWNCPWLMGALANLMAAVLYTLCWILAVCGLVEVKAKRRTNPDRNKNTNERGESRKRRRNPGRDNNTNEGSSDEGESFPASIFVTKDERTGSRSANSTCFKEEIDSKTSDVERGSNTLPLCRTDQLSQGSAVYVFESSDSEGDSKSTVSDKQLYYDGSFDGEETKSATKEIARGRQKLRHLIAKLKETSGGDSAEGSETSSIDSSSKERVVWIDFLPYKSLRLPFIRLWKSQLSVYNKIVTINKRFS